MPNSYGSATSIAIGPMSAYDRFVVTRSDQCRDDLSQLDLDFVWTPAEDEGYNGVTDCHLVSSSRNILKALNIYPSFLRNSGCEDPVDVVTDPEWVTGWCRWKEEGLAAKTFPRVMLGTKIVPSHCLTSLARFTLRAS